MSDNKEERSYIAFISYRHKELDREAAVAIQKKIEHFKVPKEFRDKTGSDMLGFCFRDEDELPTSSSLSDSIRYALDHTQFLIVICTPDLPESEWCAEEIRYFLSTHDRDHLLALLVNGEPEESFSPYMTNIYNDGGEVIRRVEPLAANITGTPEHYSRKKFRKESIRIIAALLGCPFDELWQRERRYQNRRKAVFGAAGFAALAVFAIVVGAKNLQISAKNAEISEQNRQITEKNDEITEQNRQITEQNRELQVREGKLLKEAGELQLEGHDLSGAVKNAAAALAIEDVHTEGAEHLLASALGAYSAQDVRLALAVEQDTEVDRCAMLSDGSMTFTSDRYGVVRAFIDNTEQWSFSAVPSRDRAEYLDDGRSTDLYLSGDETVLLVGNAYYAAGLSPKTGEVIWDFPKKRAVNFLAVSPDRSKFAVFNDFADECISIHSLKTGRTEAWFYLPEHTYRYMGMDLRYSYHFSDYSSGKDFGGCFSPDGNYFVFGVELGTSVSALLNMDTEEYIDEFLNEEEFMQSSLDAQQGKTNAGTGRDAEKRQDTMVYMIIDLNERSIRTAGTEPVMSGLNPVFGCTYDPEKEQLFFSRHDELDRSTYAGMIDAEGNITYTLQISDIRLNKNTVPWNYLEGEKKIAVTSANNIYIFNKADGAYEGQYELDRNVSACEWIDRENDVLMAVREDGVYNIYPLNEEGMNRYVAVYEDFPMNNLTYAASSGSGIFAWDREGLNLEAADGKWLLVSSDAPQKVMAVDIFTDPNAKEIGSGREMNKLSFPFLSADAGELFLIEKSDDGFTVYIVDPESGDLLPGCPVNGVMYLSDQAVAVCPSGKKVFYGNRAYSDDGSSEFLQYSEDWGESSFISGSVRSQSKDGTVFTAHIRRETKNKDQIYIWKNEEALCTFSVNDGSAFLLGDEDPGSGKPKETVLLKAGGNGYIIAGIRNKMDSRFTGYFIVDPEGKPGTIKTAAGTRPGSLLCTAKENSLFAALEEDGTVRIYDPALQEEPVTEITAPDGFAGAVDLCFADSDRYLGVLSYSGELALYDVKTGTLKFKNTGSGLATEYGTTEMKLFTSEDGMRLICIVSETGWADRSNGAVFDLETGERLADIPNTFTYFPKTDKVAVFRSSARIRKHFICPLYNAGSLMEWAKRQEKE